MSNIAVSDTNIFIDLYNIGLLDEFFSLSQEIHTTDFVINELTVKEQKDKVLSFVKSKLLIIKKHSSKELAEIIDFNSTCDNNVSITDCSVWLYAQKNKYLLITGDNKLRKSAISSGASVSGILYIFDQLVEQQIITPVIASNKLTELKSLNNRLPSREIEARLNLWLDKSK